jgi:hypothetical protein
MVEAVLFSAIDEWDDRSKIESFCKDVREDDILDISLRLVDDKEFIMASYVKEISPGRHRMIWVTPEVGLIVEDLTDICEPSPPVPPPPPPSPPPPPPSPSHESKSDLAD